MMAKKAKLNLDDHGTELLRYFSGRYRCLVSRRSTGEVLTKTLSEDWRPTHKVKRVAGLSDEEYLAAVRLASHELELTLKSWQINATLPSLATVKKWIVGEGDVKSPTGHTVDPDGAGPDGVPSWLVLLGMI
jgi:hypothetical protein